MIPLDTEALKRASAGNPGWLAAQRATAFDTFTASNPPSSKEELWRYVDLDFALADFSLPTEPAPAVVDDADIAVVDGLVSGSAAEVEGAEILTLADALAGGAVDERVFAAIGSAHQDQFSSAALAFGSDGAFVRIPKRSAVSRPLVVAVEAAADAGVSFPRVVVAAEEGSEASLILQMRSPDDIAALVVPEVDVAIGPNANVRITIVQDFGDATNSIARMRVVVDRDASLTLAEAGIGGSLSRLHLAVDLEGRGSSAQIIGAYFGDRDQVLDYRYFMRHIGENTYSDMFLKGGVEDQALSVFTGMIRIEETAQRTNAFQTNRNLLLSDDAKAQSVPNLEILANDVKCGHGSTVGPLDAEQRYYLQSRGLDRERADRLQVRGFFEEAIARFPDRDVAGPVRRRINAKYEDALREGRV